MRQRAGLRCGALAVFVAAGGLIIHELGHALTVAALGGQVVGIYVAPGVQIWPEPGAAYPGDFPYMGITRFFPGPGWRVADFGLVGLMGTGATTLTAMLALLLLWLWRPAQPGIRCLLVLASLLHLDLLTYATLPLLGLRHWVIVGGDTAEPVLAAERLGIERAPFVAGVVILCTLLLWALWSLGRQPAGTPPETLVTNVTNGP